MIVLDVLGAQLLLLGAQSLNPKISWDPSSPADARAQGGIRPTNMNNTASSISLPTCQVSTRLLAGEAWTVLYPCCAYRTLPGAPSHVGSA